MLAFPKPGMMMTGEPSISAKVRSDARRGANITLRSDVGCIAAAVAAAAMRWNIVGARTGYAMNEIQARVLESPIASTHNTLVFT